MMSQYRFFIFKLLTYLLKGLLSLVSDRDHQ